jgi:hypothetical protein
MEHTWRKPFEGKNNSKGRHRSMNTTYGSTNRNWKHPPYPYGSTNRNRKHLPYPYGSTNRNRKHPPYSYGSSDRNRKHSPYPYGSTNRNPKHLPYFYDSANRNPKAEVALAGQCHYVKEFHFRSVITAHVLHPEKRGRDLLIKCTFTIHMEIG